MRDTDVGITDYGAQQRADDQGKKRSAQAQKRAHHSHQLHVAQAQPFTVAQLQIQPAAQPEEEGGHGGAQGGFGAGDRVPGPVRPRQPKQAPDDAIVYRDEPGQHQRRGHSSESELIWQNALLQVAEDQADQERAIEAEFQGGQGGSQAPDIAEEQRAGQDLDYRITPGNPRVAIAAASAEQHIAQHGNIVIPGDG